MDDEVGAAVCSAKGCRAIASWAVVWNNPGCTPDREKVWAACDEPKQPPADPTGVARGHVSFRASPEGPQAEDLRVVG